MLYNVTLITAKLLLANSYLRQKIDFTVKVQYVQIPRQLIYCQRPLLAYYITKSYKFIHPAWRQAASRALVSDTLVT